MALACVGRLAARVAPAGCFRHDRAIDLVLSGQPAESAGTRCERAVAGVGKPRAIDEVLLAYIESPAFVLRKEPAE